jgi:hypothetical protein
MLLVTSDGGNTWNFKTVSDLPKYVNVNSVSCGGSSDTAVCTVVGAYRNESGSVRPLILVSKDGAKTWSIKYLDNDKRWGEYKTVSCSGTNKTVCIAAGLSTASSSPDTIMLLGVSTDGGDTWIDKSTSDSRYGGYYNSSSCTGEGATAICIAAGYALGFGGSPTLTISKDGGLTWKTQYTGFYGSGIFNLASAN